MIGLDTNVLVRYLTRDDETQWQQTVDLITAGETCFISNIVLCELVWVLESKQYQLSKSEILETLEQMLQSPEFEFEDRTTIYRAIQRTQQGQADFSDYLIGTTAEKFGCDEIVSFDRQLKNQTNFRVLGE